MTTIHTTTATTTDNSTKQLFIYVLKLEKGKFYIGKTDDVQRRFKEHCEGKGSGWTRQYKPNKIVSSMPQKDEFHELNETLRWMKNFGIENVRGSRYCQLTLTSLQKHNIEKDLLEISEKCYVCGGKGHYAKECKNKKEISESLKKPQAKKNNNCFRCGRSGHWVRDCYAKTDIHGNSLVDEEDEGTPPSSNENGPCCYRCGRNGHYTDECYARTDVDHYLIR